MSCCTNKYPGNCGVLSENEIREAIRTAQAAACNAAQAAREAEKATNDAEKLANAAQTAVAQAENAAQNAGQCALAAEAAKDRIALMLDQANGGNGSGCGCSEPAYRTQGPSCGCRG